MLDGTIRKGNYRADYHQLKDRWFVYDKTDSRVDTRFGCPNYVMAICFDRESAKRIVDALAHVQALNIGAAA